MIYYSVTCGLVFAVLIAGALMCAWRIARADFRRRIIPDAFLFPLMLVGLVVVQFFPWICTPAMSVLGGVFGYALGAMVGYAFDCAARRRNAAAPAPIGMGDIKLLGVGGIWLGPTGLSLALVLSCIGGAVWARWRHEKYIPFAPFFIAGGILALLGMRFLL